MSKNLIICDLDGTLANIEHRLHYIKGPKNDWASFNKACVDDTVYKDVNEILFNLYDAGPIVPLRTVYFFSGRSEVVRKETEEWLKEHVSVAEYRDWELHMRKEGDFRNDVEVKREMIHSLNITPDDVLCILDDRQGVVDMWRQEGFRCLQVDAWKEEPKRHHLMDADLDDLNTEELKFLVTRERGYYNEVTDRLLNTLIKTEKKLDKWCSDTACEMRTPLFTPADAWQEGCDSDPDWETKKIAEAKRLSREVLLKLTTTRKEDNNER